MYESLLFIHSWTRWIVFMALVLFFARSLKGLLRKEPWTGRENYILWAFNQVFGYQIGFGLALWIAFSPFTKMAFRDSSQITENPVVGFWSVQHGLTMLVAFSVWHYGRMKIRRAKAENRFRVAAITMGAVLAIVTSAIPWPWFSYGRPLLRWFL